MVVGPVLFAGVLAAPIPALNWEQQTLVAIYAWAVAYWLTEAVPVAVTALLSSLLAVILGVASARTVFSAYGDPEPHPELSPLLKLHDSLTGIANALPLA